MLASRHQSLIDYLRGIVPTSVDVYALFHNGIRSGAQSLPRLVPTRLDLGSLGLGLSLSLGLCLGCHLRREIRYPTRESFVVGRSRFGHRAIEQKRMERAS